MNIPGANFNEMIALQEGPPMLTTPKKIVSSFKAFLLFFYISFAKMKFRGSSVQLIFLVPWPFWK